MTLIFLKTLNHRTPKTRRRIRGHVISVMCSMSGCAEGKGSSAHMSLHLPRLPQEFWQVFWCILSMVYVWVVIL